MGGTNGHSHCGTKKADGRGKHPNSLANLRPCAPGETHNPNGRPAAGATVREWWNQMQDWTKAQLEEVIQDDGAPSAKVAAAHIWLYARNGQGNELERIMEHTAGKARQSLELSGGLDHRHAERDDANKMLSDPVAREAAMALAERMAQMDEPGKADAPGDN